MDKSVLPYLIIIVLSCMFVACDGQRNYLENDGYFYDSRYDYLDIDTIVSNKRLVKNYVDCLLNLKPCPPEGKALKRILPEALRTKCARCSPRQKQNAVFILRRLRILYPVEWDRLADKWDPTGDLTKSFEKILETDDNNNVDRPIRTTKRPFTTARPTLFNGAMEMEDPDRGNMGAPSEIKPTVEVYPATYRPFIISTASTNSVKTTPYYTEVFSTTRKPTKTRKPTVRSTTVKNKYKPHTTTFYPNYKPVIFKPIYAGTMDLIDHFGTKIIKTTNIVTDLLKNTVRVVAGAKAGKK